mmetsp:Transcript_67953/g.150662  ORF Transcript_67953/g.150662 Transcript_67953/m.150662 type:complete len:491 (+) Transcript_67953:184-1656(+)
MTANPRRLRNPTSQRLHQPPSLWWRSLRRPFCRTLQRRRLRTLPRKRRTRKRKARKRKTRRRKTTRRKMRTNRMRRWGRKRSKLPPKTRTRTNRRRESPPRSPRKSATRKTRTRKVMKRWRRKMIKKTRIPKRRLPRKRMIKKRAVTTRTRTMRLQRRRRRPKTVRAQAQRERRRTRPQQKRRSRRMQIRIATTLRPRPRAKRTALAVMTAKTKRRRTPTKRRRRLNKRRSRTATPLTTVQMTRRRRPRKSQRRKRRNEVPALQAEAARRIALVAQKGRRIAAEVIKEVAPSAETSAAAAAIDEERRVRARAGVAPRTDGVADRVATEEGLGTGEIVAAAATGDDRRLDRTSVEWSRTAFRQSEGAHLPKRKRNVRKPRQMPRRGATATTGLRLPRQPSGLRPKGKQARPVVWLQSWLLRKPIRSAVKVLGSLRKMTLMGRARDQPGWHRTMRKRRSMVPRPMKTMATAIPSSLQFCLPWQVQKTRNWTT